MNWRRGPAGRGGDDLTVFVDQTSTIEGHCAFGGTAMVDGRVSGEIVSSGTLIIGEHGVVHATVRGATVLVSGEVVGTIEASQRLELRPGARVFGDVQAPALVVAEGALLEGHCRMRGAAAAAADAVPPVRDASVVPLKR